MANKQPTYEQLYGKMRRAVNGAHEAMLKHGPESKQFKKAEAEAFEFMLLVNRARLGL